jgi:hypothetical protein
MATAKGANFQLLMCEEATWGTTPATPLCAKLPISGIGGDWFRQNLLDNPELRGNRNPPAPVSGNISVSGSFTQTLHLDAIGWTLKHAIGVPATSGSGTFTHVGKVGFSGASAGDLPAGMTFEHGFTDIDCYYPYTGCRVSTLAVSGSAEGVATFDVGIIGQTRGSKSATSIDAAPVEFTSDALSHFAGSITEGGSPIAYITEVNFTLDNGLDDSLRTFGGSGLIVDLPENMASVTGQVTALFQNDTLLAKAVAGTESSMTVAWTSGSYSLTFEVPELRFEARSPSISGDRGVMITLPFRAYYANDADATILKYTLVNDVSAYSAIAAGA